MGVDYTGDRLGQSWRDRSFTPVVSEEKVVFLITYVEPDESALKRLVYQGIDMVGSQKDVKQVTQPMLSQMLFLFVVVFAPMWLM